MYKFTQTTTHTFQQAYTKLRDLSFGRELRCRMSWDAEDFTVMLQTASHGVPWNCCAAKGLTGGLSLAGEIHAWLLSC